MSNKTESATSDVTIDEFANSSRTTARFKKATTNVSSEVKREVSIEAANQHSWCDEMDDYRSHEKDKSKKVATSSQRQAKKSCSEENQKEEEGVDYPLDLWFVISEYIDPESVGKFARICKSSYHVTTTGKFWFHLYKSYYRFVPNLPQRLQPQCMVRTHGLRACVIRSLHYSYFALNREVSYLRQDEPHSLVRRRCCLMWHEEGKVRWYFFFKLKQVPNRRDGTVKRKPIKYSKRNDFVEMLEDVAVNSEDGCKVLRVTCLKYSMLPPVIGLILQTVSMTLMPGFKDHRLQLGFGTSDVPSTLTVQIILNYVISYKVLDWWDPGYPHQDDAVTAIDLPEHSDSWD